ncbi:MAG TPA: tetratricopeptide repeat protein [Burkholderiales bacterium]|nr:tetratricopeptide repeat protein [Burkholderiales bacterium]
MQNFLKMLITAALAFFSLVIPPMAAANMGAEESSESSDPNFLEGKKALEAQDWKKAIGLLSSAVQNTPNNADARNFLGYAYRKTGNYDAAFDQYNEALKLNPSHKSAHEYVGEAYLLTGNLPKAEQHLAELRRICTPIPCEEYKELKRAVDAYKKTKK